jgi:hypothetical protein
MRERNRSFIVFAIVTLAAAGAASAQALKVEGYFPRQIPLGQTTVISVAVPSRDAIQSAEIAPAAGVKIAGIKAGAPIQGALTWSEITVDVAKDAAPGERTLVLALPSARTIPVSLLVPTHVPVIADLRVQPAPPAASNVDVQLSFVDADVGDSPYVWFTVDCGGDPLVGVVRGKTSARERNGGVIRAAVPKPQAEPGSPPARPCVTRVRVTDAAGIESNTLSAK